MPYFPFGHCLILRCFGWFFFILVNFGLCSSSLAVNLPSCVCMWMRTFAKHVAFGSFPLHRAIHVFRVDYFQILITYLCLSLFCSCTFLSAIHARICILNFYVYARKQCTRRRLFIDHIIFNNFVSAQVHVCIILCLSLFFFLVFFLLEPLY